jgi:hypothetical protein
MGRIFLKRKERWDIVSKIYIITCGCYSDYSIYGATTDPHRAEDMRKKVSAGAHDEAYIEEYEDGVFPDIYEKYENYEPIQYWCVTFKSNKEYPEAYSYIAKHKSVKVVTSSQEKGPCEFRMNLPPRYEIYNVYRVDCIVAKDKDHAIKIAADTLAEYRAQEEIIT